MRVQVARIPSQSGKHAGADEKNTRAGRLPAKAQDAGERQAKSPMRRPRPAPFPDRIPEK